MPGDQNLVQDSMLPDGGGSAALPRLPLAAEGIDIGAYSLLPPPLPPRPGPADVGAAELVQAFWSEKTARAQAWPEEQVRSSRLANIAAQEPRLQKFLDVNSEPHTRAADYARIFSAINFYSGSEAAAKGDFSGLNLFGIETSNKSAKIESSWGMLKDLAQFYVERAELSSQQSSIDHIREVRSQGMLAAWHRFATDHANAVDDSVLASVVTKHFRAVAIETEETSHSVSDAIYRSLCAVAEDKLAEKLKCPASAVPLPYAFFMNGKTHGTLMPDSKTIVRLNQALLSPDGANVFLFCCPDYSRERLPDGTYHYTMRDLGTGTGLTGERALPVVNDVVKRLKSLADSTALASPINLRIGFADFEATPSNAARCGMGPNPEEFLRRLGVSAQAIEAALQKQLPPGLDLIQIHDEFTREDPLGRIEAQIVDRESGQLLANVSIGRVTDTFREFNPGFEGISTFDELVEKERVNHIRFATADLSTFAEGKERGLAQGFRRALDTLLVLRLDLMLEWKTDAVPDYVRDNLESRVPFEDKAGVIRDLQEGMAAGDVGKTEALQYLRAKIAAQGAEYAVMHSLMAKAPNVLHLYADAANMWQLFGKKSVPMLGVRGGYTGADVVDLSGT